MKEYENDSVSLLMAKYNDVWDSTTRTNLYLIAFLTFHVVKKQHICFFITFFFISFFPYCFIELLFPVINPTDWN